jgi:hypothetical protein
VDWDKAFADLGDQAVEVCPGHGIAPHHGMDNWVDQDVFEPWFFVATHPECLRITS